MKVAAVQLQAEFANVDVNLSMARRLVGEAFQRGAEWVILPEFFPSGIGFHPRMLDVAEEASQKSLDLLEELSMQHHGVVGGSYIAARGHDFYNRFVLAFPDGKVAYHDKDQPTMWENCYYVGGNDDGVLNTPVGNVGVAMCWEFIRARTARRLLGRVGLVVGGSCWWTLPRARVPGFSPALLWRNVEIASQAPAKLARMLGVPVIHAAHAGDFECRLPLVPWFTYKSYYVGETQIVDATGIVLGHLSREDGEGIIVADIDIASKPEPLDPVPGRFWVPELPWQLRFAWRYKNWHGRRYYRKVHP